MEVMNDDRSLFKQALIDATLELSDEMRDGKRVEYSARHKKRMRSMGVAIGLPMRAKIMVILVAAAILLTGCAVFREQIAGLIFSFGNRFIFIDGVASPDAPKEIEQIYSLTYTPEGFTEAKREAGRHKVRTVWENENGDYIEVLQGVIYGIGFKIKKEYAENAKIIELPEFDIYNAEIGNYSFFIWSDGYYSFQIKANHVIDQSTAIEIIESLK